MSSKILNLPHWFGGYERPATPGDPPPPQSPGPDVAMIESNLRALYLTTIPGFNGFNDAAFSALTIDPLPPTLAGLTTTTPGYKTMYNPTQSDGTALDLKLSFDYSMNADVKDGDYADPNDPNTWGLRYFVWQAYFLHFDSLLVERARYEIIQTDPDPHILTITMQPDDILRIWLWLRIDKFFPLYWPPNPGFSRDTVTVNWESGNGFGKVGSFTMVVNYW